MIEFQVLVLSALTLLIIAVLILFRVFITRNKHDRRQIKALTGYMKEPEEQKGDGLTEKQADALIRLVEGLIDSIKANH